MLTGAAVFLYFAHIFLSTLGEEYKFRKGHLFSYYVFSTRTVRNLPQPQMAGEAEYFYSGEEGTKAEYYGVSFASTATKEELLNEFHGFLTNAGYQKGTNCGIQDYCYRSKEGDFEFSINNSGENLRLVRAEDYRFH